MNNAIKPIAEVKTVIQTRIVKIYLNFTIILCKEKEDEKR